MPDDSALHVAMAWESDQPFEKFDTGQVIAALITAAKAQFPDYDPTEDDEFFGPAFLRSG